LTDGNIPDRKVLANKLVNVLYKNYEEKGEKFTITIPDLLRSLGMTSDSGNNRKKIKEVIKFLQYPIELRDFKYKGKGIAWISAPFLSRAIIEKDNSTIVHFKLDDMLIEALKQKKEYTVIDINISNQFRTKYGIVIWEMYLRYKNQKRDDEIWTYQSFTLEQLNHKFATSHKYTSKMLEGINRGLQEIKKITDKDITITYDKQKKQFVFWWQREKQPPKYLKSQKAFIFYIRENYKANVEKNEYPTIFTNPDGTQIKVNFKGHLYAVKDKNTIDFNKDDAQKIWDQLYKLAKDEHKF